MLSELPPGSLVLSLSGTDRRALRRRIYGIALGIFALGYILGAL